MPKLTLYMQGFILSKWHVQHGMYLLVTLYWKNNVICQPLGKLN